MSGFLEILEKVKAKPGMYIGQASLTNLFMFLAGYKTALREVGILPNEQEMEFHREFQPWIQKKFQLQTVNSWANIILLYSVDEKEAFSYFFRLLEEFLQRDKSLEVDKVKPAAREVTASTASG
jgi:hypothetical protein